MSIYAYNAVENISIDHLSGERGVTQKIKGAMQDAARQFVYIGFLLWEVKQYEYFYEGNYNSVYEYAETELGFKRSSTKNLIAICENFCRKDKNFNGIPTMFLDEKWTDFQYSQLTEMLAMSAKQRDQAKPEMTVKQLRQLKKEKEAGQKVVEQITAGQTSGQKTENKSMVVNNYWCDTLPPEIIKLICNAARIKYNPKSCYNIKIELHKG